MEVATVSFFGEDVLEHPIVIRRTEIAGQGDVLIVGEGFLVDRSEGGPIVCARISESTASTIRERTSGRMHQLLKDLDLLGKTRWVGLGLGRSDAGHLSL